MHFKLKTIKNYSFNQNSRRYFMPQIYKKKCQLINV